jgi:dihydrolipoamide dehydrogenase
MGDLVREVDVAVVGGGPGGYAAAFRCAELGLDTVVVDAHGRLGGVCLWQGCVPSKTLLHVAAFLREVARAREWGVDLGEPRVALDVLRTWTYERVVGRLARGLAAVARTRGVEVIAGRAVFEGARALRVVGESSQRIRFRHAVVATGAVPSRPPGLDLASERVLDAAAALEIREVPERLLVVGGGYIGLELGQIYAALGSRVWLAEMADGLLPGVDRDLVEPLERRCEQLFADILLKTAVTELREVEGGVQARLGDSVATFDRVVLALGRRPCTEELGLETTRVRCDERGFIDVDAQGRTAEPTIWAAGDVTGEPMLAHRAMCQGKVVAEAIAGRPVAFDPVAVPRVVFTDPEVAWSGLGELEAHRAGHAVRVARVQWPSSGRAVMLGRTDGLTKLVVDAGSGRVLGVGIVGVGASELIAEGTLAVEGALTAEDLALTVHAHPTLAETLAEAAHRMRP